MRLLWITLPASLALVCAGGLLLLRANQPQTNSDLLSTAAVRHPVTLQMMEETAEQSKKVAPAFDVKDTDGKSVSIAPPQGERPQFVYFVLDGCPCSYDAEPLFHRLAKRYQGKVDFISVTDAGAEKAKDWYGQMLVPYPVISDPKKEIIKAYGAKSSVYAALVTKSGRIEKMWPGYSQDILAEQNKLMAKLTGTKVEPFDAQYAPVERATGCSF